MLFAEGVTIINHVLVYFPQFVLTVPAAVACPGLCLTHRPADRKLRWSSGHLGSFEWHPLTVRPCLHRWSHTSCCAFRLYI